MDEEDDGKFYYHLSSAPLCIHDTKHGYTPPVRYDLNPYFQFSSRITTHEDALLDSGMTMGEAAVIFFRTDLHKVRKDPSQNHDQPILDIIAIALLENMQVDVYGNAEYCAQFHKHLHDFHINHNLSLCMHTLTTQLKFFLGAINRKSKGYTTQLRSVIDQVQSYVKTAQGIRNSHRSTPAS